MKILFKTDFIGTLKCSNGEYIRYGNHEYFQDFPMLTDGLNEIFPEETAGEYTICSIIELEPWMRIS